MDMKILIDDVEIFLDSKVKQRMIDIHSKKVTGKTEIELDTYLKKEECRLTEWVIH